MVDASDGPSLFHTRIMELIRRVWAGHDITGPELQAAVPFREFALLSEEKQFCIFAEVYNVVRTEADLLKALAPLKSLSYRFKAARYSFRRLQVADELFTAVQQGTPCPDSAAEAFGIHSDHHERALYAAVRDGRLTRRQAIFCAYNGAALNRALGPIRISVPFRFQTRQDMSIRQQREESPGVGSRVRFERIQQVGGDGARFKMRVSNPVELWRALTFSTKEPETVRWLTTTLGAGSVLYDVGANVGIFTLLALSARRDTRVISFEPDALNFARLVDNLHLNGFGARAVAYAVGLSDQTMIARFHSSGFIVGQAENWISGGNGEVPPQQQGVVVTGCPIYTLDEFIAAQPDLPAPTHLKIDVDGPELRILRGAAGTLAGPGLRQILVELFDDELAQVTALLSAYGFSRSGGKRHLEVPGRGYVGNHIFSR